MRLPHLLDHTKFCAFYVKCNVPRQICERFENSRFGGESRTELSVKREVSCSQAWPIPH
jgi:hypothetical protein